MLKVKDVSKLESFGFDKGGYLQIEGFSKLYYEEKEPDYPASYINIDENGVVDTEGREALNDVYELSIAGLIEKIEDSNVQLRDDRF